MGKIYLYYFPREENLSTSRRKKADNKNIFLYPGITFATVYRQFRHIFYQIHYMIRPYNYRIHICTGVLHTPHTFNIKYFVSNKNLSTFANFETTFNCTDILKVEVMDAMGRMVAE